MSRLTMRYPFYIGLTTLVVLIVLVLSGSFLWISHRESKVAALRQADRLFAEINAKILGRLENDLNGVANLVNSASRAAGMSRRPIGDGLDHPGLNLMLGALASHPNLFSIYIGYADGSFIQVVDIARQASLQKVYNAPPEAVHVLRTIAANALGEMIQRWSFLDRYRTIIGHLDELDPGFDPRRRPWYHRAMEKQTQIFTEPYVFSATGDPGITCAAPLTGGQGVFGADITLARFSATLAQQRLSEHGRLFLFDRMGRLVAHPVESTVMTYRDDSLRLLPGAESNDPLVRAVVASHAIRAFGGTSHAREVVIGNTDYLVCATLLDASLAIDQILIAIAPVDDFTGHIRRMQQRIFLFAGAVLLAMLPIVLIMSRKISASLARLAQEAMRIRQFDFSPTPPFDSSIREIHTLIRAFDLMRGTIRDRTDALIATQNQLRTLVESGIALTAETDMDRLLEKIFDGARALSRADGGALYLTDDNGGLRLLMVQGKDGKIIRSASDNDPQDADPSPITAPDSARQVAVEAHVARSGETVVINRVAGSTQYDLSDACRLGDAAGSACSNILTTPLGTRSGKTIGVLQVFNRRDEKRAALQVFDTQMVEFVEALSAQAAIALENTRLLEEQRTLFDAFVKLIAGAIDAKSPYTGGHCARVPEIATRLAKAAHEVRSGPFAGFKMESQDQWREFEVAAWLHDCGKVTTPEYVVDKATKLETIYNRIHEIRMRFEVLLRDAEIDILKRQLRGEASLPELSAELDDTRQRIRADFAFVAECNIGGESMAAEAIERLRDIAGRTWMRHLDDRLGLSQEEHMRKATLPVHQLPVAEPLLADRPEHVIDRKIPDPFAGNPFGFRMPVPAALYNQGEIYNLSLRKGTLSPEDRFKIQEHIVQTIIMLERLPFPEYLKRVPEIAGAHHETMNGTGYPRGLRKDQMSVPARIMAIADIFEALTAADRPYKSPKPLSQALAIMGAMRDEGHIDPDLFDLFLTRRVYLSYARKFMHPSQIDDVDIDGLLDRRPDAGHLTPKT